MNAAHENYVPSHDTSATVTAKWGTHMSGGRAGDEHHNLAPVAPTLNAGIEHSRGLGNQDTASLLMPEVASLNAKPARGDADKVTYVPDTYGALTVEDEGGRSGQSAGAGMLIAGTGDEDGYDADDDLMVLTVPLSGDAAGGRSGEAETPSADAEGRVRLRPPSAGIGDDGDPAFTLAAGAVPGVMTAQPSLEDFLADGGAASFEQRFARNDRGAPSEIGAPLKAQSGADGRGDGAPMVIHTANLHDEDKGRAWVDDEVGALQASGDTPNQGQYIFAEGPDEPAHALTGEGADAMEDGSGRGTPLIFNVQTNDGGAHRRGDRPDGGMYVSEADEALTLGTSDLTAIVEPLACLEPCDRCGQPDVTGRCQHLDAGHFCGPCAAVNHGVPMTPIAFDDRNDTIGSADRVTGKQGGLAIGADDDASLTGGGYDAPQSGRVYGPEAQMPAVDAHHNAKPGVMAAATVRRLTPTECERLQAFEDGWTCFCGDDPCSCSDGPRYRAMGNAVTVSVIQYIGERIMRVDAAMRARGDV